MLRVLFFVARDEKVSEDVRQQAQALLAKAVEPSAEYSAMARAAIDHNFSALPES